MNDRNLAQLLDAWLDAGPSVAPSRVTAAARLEIRSTRQSAVPLGWLLWRFPTMNNTVRIALVSAAVVAVAVIGFSLFRGMNVGGPDLTGPSPSPTPEPAVLTDGPLEAGTYTTMPFPSPDDAIQFTFTVPDGWTGDLRGPAVFPSSGDGTSGPAGAAMALLRVAGLYDDPCQGNTGQPDIQVGPTVDDLVTALADRSAYESTAATDVVVDGYAGKQLELLMPSDIDFATCDGGQFWVWDRAPYAQGLGNRWQVTILDVDGTRAVILAEDFADTPTNIQTELQAIVDSVQIDAP